MADEETTPREGVTDDRTTQPMRTPVDHALTGVDPDTEATDPPGRSVNAPVTHPQPPEHLRATGEQRVTSEATLAAEWVRYREELVAEMGDKELVDDYVNALRKRCGDDIQEAARLVDERVRELWGPIIKAFVRWMFETTRPEQTIVLLLRDAWPIGKVIQHMQATGNGSHVHRKVVPLYLTRKMLGMGDESGHAVEIPNEEVLREYIAPLFDDDVVIVDTGCWGTILGDLHRRFGLTLEARFFFAHNPFVPSFLHYLGLPSELGEILNDSWEVLIAKRHHRIKPPKVLDKDPKKVSGEEESDADDSTMHQDETGQHDKVVRGANGKDFVVRREPTGTIAYVLHFITKSALFLAEMPTEEKLRGLVRRCLELAVSSSAEGRWTGFLPRNTPTWAGGQEFLDSYPQVLRTANPPALLTANLDPNRPKVVLAGIEWSGLRNTNPDLPPGE